MASVMASASSSNAMPPQWQLPWYFIGLPPPSVQPRQTIGLCGGVHAVVCSAAANHPSFPMSRPLSATSLLAPALAACPGQAPTTPATPPGDAAAAAAVESAQDQAFAALAARFLDEGLALSPVAATQIGDHRFDSELDDLGAEGRQRSADWARGMLAELDAI